MAAVASVFILAYDTGCGAGHIAATSRLTDSGMCLPPPSTLDVIYERNNGGVSDFIHLQVDTTYAARGKGAYGMQSSCNRRLSARIFDGTYHPTDIRPEQCFVFNADGASQWRETGATRRIAGYDCRCAEATFNGRTWQVWYTDRLPHCADGAVATDRLSGLILEATAMQGGEYSLRARYIDQKIG